MQADIGQSAGGRAETVQRIDALLRGRRLADADPLCRALTRDDPKSPEGWMLTARLRQQQGDFPAMLEAAQEAAALTPGKSLPRFILIEALFHAGKVAEARATLKSLEADAGPDAAVWMRLSAVHTHCGQHEGAARCARQALSLRPDDSEAEQALTASLIALGAFGEAESLLDKVIAAAPMAFDAYYNRTTLRRQTPDAHHKDELVSALATAKQHPGGETPVRYALGKTCEDLGEYDSAFEHISNGAAARKRMLSYQVQTDIDAINAIIKTFNADWCAQQADGYGEAQPIFVTGLPRSGTTLVERILAAHPQTGSVGEVQDLALAVMRAGGPAQDRRALIAGAAKADPARMGREYWRAVCGYGLDAPRIIDKTPLNFLYLGLIAKAMPNARIVHLRRHPMASGYAMFKTLFRMGYPFSYDLEDIARYYAAYRRLMTHWRTVLPGRFLDVDYEALVDDPETASRAIVAHCGLDWDPACLDFHASAAPSATASAAQVRQPIYRHARDLWRRYEAPLQPLAAALKQQGVVFE